MSSAATPARPGFPARVRTTAPGVALCAAIAGVAWALAKIEVALIDYAVVEAVVLAILIGMLIRTVWTPPKRFEAGIGFTAKRVLEVAIVLLGASLDLRSLEDLGYALLAAVVVTTGAALGLGIVAGRRAGLSRNLAILVAVGNAICGNSAIAAVAPVIRAKKQEIASAISLTAVLGVVVVLLLPLVQGPAGLSDRQYGILAGMAVYAVPQVLAATFPVSDAAGQVGALVKLIRVALLGPVVALFAFLNRTDEEGAPVVFSLRRYLPWFLVGFFLTAILRTAGAIPAGAGSDAKELSRWLTVAAMAGLGLGVDVRAVRQTGPRVAAVVAGLLLMLVVLGIALIRLFGLE
jgi:uncharacterized integral membrane protein (TIGR00698 family)